MGFLLFIAAIGVIAFIVFYFFDPLSKINMDNDAKRKEDLSKIQVALENYRKIHGSYPSSTQGKIDNNNWGFNWEGNLEPLPKDPESSGRSYYYFSDQSRNNQTYRIYASLSSENDPALCKSGEVCSGAAAINAKCGEDIEAICNYAVSSPNISPF